MIDLRPRRLLAASALAGTVDPTRDVPASNAAHSTSASASLLRGALALVSTQPITWAASLLVAIFVPQFLGDSVLGAMTVALAIAGMAGTIVSLGLPDYLVRRVATQPAMAAADAGGTLVLMLGASSLAALGLVAAVPLMHIPGTESDILLLALAGMVVGPAQTVLLSVLRGQEHHRSFALLNAGATMANAAVGIAVLALGGGITGYMLVSVASSIVATVIGWRKWGVSLRGLRLDMTHFGALLRGGLPFLGWALALRMYGEIDKLLLPAFAPVAVVGWYSAAYRIIGIPGFIPTIVCTPLLPVLSRCSKDPRVFAETVQRAVLVVLVLVVPLSAGLLALAPAVPWLLHWPSAFEGAVPLMMILCVHLPVVGVDMVLGTSLFALRREKAWLVVGIAATLFNPALNLVLIPFCEQTLHNGAIGASIATVLTELLMFVGAVIVLPRGIVDWSTLSISARVVLAGVCVAAVATVLRDTSLPLSILAGGVSYVGAMGLLGLLQPARLTVILDVVRQSLPRGTASAGSV